jgi:hypothetical protein
MIGIYVDNCLVIGNCDKIDELIVALKTKIDDRYSRVFQQQRCSF